MRKELFVFKKHEVYNHALMLLPKSPLTLMQSEIHTTILEATTALILILMIRRQIPLGFCIKNDEKSESFLTNG